MGQLTNIFIVKSLTNVPCKFFLLSDTNLSSEQAADTTNMMNNVWYLLEAKTEGQVPC